MGLFDRKKNRENKVEISPYTISMTAHEPTSEEIKEQFKNDTQRRIRNFQKDEEDLYPHEILMLSYLEKYSSGAEPARFWEQKYGVEDTDVLIKSLEERGFAYDGKLTDKGKEEIKKNEYVLYMHQHQNYDISMEEMSILVNRNPDRPFRDILWSEFNRLSQEYVKVLNYGNYRNMQYTMYLFLLEEKRYQDALCMLSVVIFMDLNSKYHEILPRMVKNVLQIEHKLNMTEEEMINMLLKRLSDDMFCEHRFFTTKEVVRIIAAYAYGYNEIAQQIIDGKKPLFEDGVNK